MGYESTLSSGDVAPITTDLIISIFVGLGLFTLFIGGAIAVYVVAKGLPVKLGR